MENILQDPVLWLWVSFIIFIILIGRPVWKIIINTIDSESDSIGKKLEFSKKTLKEAKNSMEEALEKEKISINQSEIIIQNSKQEKENLKIKTDKDISEMLKREEKRASDNIKNLENKLKKDIQEKAARISIKETKEIISLFMSEKEFQNSFNNQILKEIQKVKIKN